MADRAFFDELIGHEQLKKTLDSPYRGRSSTTRFYFFRPGRDGENRGSSGSCVGSCRTKSIATHRFFST